MAKIGFSPLHAYPVARLLLCLAAGLAAGFYSGPFSNCLAAGNRFKARVTLTHQFVASTPTVKSLGETAVQQVAVPATPSCWSCIKSGWRQHFIFASSSSSHLDACPDSSSWPAGTWYQTQASVSLRHSMSSHRDSQQQQVRPAMPGEAAVLPGTLLAQQALMAHQHPADCSAAKFVVFKAHRSGIGSVLHVEGAAMSAALETGRVFLEAPGHLMTNTSYCGSHTTLDSCYFEPLSNCTLAMAGITPQEVEAAPKLTAAELKEFAASNPRSPRVVFMDVHDATSFQRVFPSIFTKGLDVAMVPTARRYWWWRAQSTAYIVRPNTRSLLEIAARKQAKLRGNTLQKGCISLHVRHGDKFTENKVWDDVAYEAAVTQLRNIDSSLTGQLFLATEDPKTVEYFQTRTHDWNTTVVDMKRKPDPNVSTMDYMAQHGYSEEMLDCLLSLDLALTCDGFVGSFHSNWARLIEEMRSTVRCKAQRVYFDVGGFERMQRSGGLDLDW